MEIMAYGGQREYKVMFDAAQGARWDDFDTCLGMDDAVGTVVEGAAADCSNKFGLKVTVLRLTGSDEVVASGSCCNRHHCNVRLVILPRAVNRAATRTRATWTVRHRQA